MKHKILKASMMIVKLQSFILMVFHRMLMISCF